MATKSRAAGRATLIRHERSRSGGRTSARTWSGTGWRAVARATTSSRGPRTRVAPSHEPRWRQTSNRRGPAGGRAPADAFGRPEVSHGPRAAHRGAGERARGGGARAGADHARRAAGRRSRAHITGFPAVRSLGENPGGGGGRRLRAGAWARALYAAW